MGYKAAYPEEAINGHRAFIARRRATWPSEEYRSPTDAEWEEFLGLSASLAHGTPVSLRDTITGLDDGNITRVVTAIRHAAGKRPENGLSSSPGPRRGDRNFLPNAQII
jgi:hypothetical protein